MNIYTRFQWRKKKRQ